MDLVSVSSGGSRRTIEGGSGSTNEAFRISIQTETEETTAADTAIQNLALFSISLRCTI